MFINCLFYTYKKLQGSQTRFIEYPNWDMFYTYKKLQGSQTPFSAVPLLASFTLIRNYKVLKH